MPVKFGYCVEAPMGWPDMLRLARELDTNSNFDSFWIGDSLLPNGPPDQPKLEAWTALAAIAQATSRLRLGLRVSANALRTDVGLVTRGMIEKEINRRSVEL